MKLSFYQQLIHKTRYARALETWKDTVQRYIEYMKYKTKGKWINYNEIEYAIENMDVMPSMRLLRTAGAACEADNTCAYNCSYIVIDSPKSFGEVMHNLMCGCGVGFSLEKVKYFKPIPNITRSNEKIVIEDSKNGWSEAYEKLIYGLMNGVLYRLDYSLIRKEGEILKTFGGSASGAFPLASLFEFVSDIFMVASGRNITETEVHDILCKTATIIQCGGVRRSALLSLNTIDLELKKSLNAFSKVRHLANNSILIQENSPFDFYNYWLNVVRNGNGEPGFFNRQAARRKRFDANEYCGVNPCGEAILNSREFCNLSEIIGRTNDTKDSIKEKLRIATILGTYQASLTNFKYLSNGWAENCSNSRLLGVSISGVCDSNYLLNITGSDLQELKQTVINTNEEYARLLGINKASACTCIKPSGTVSQLVDCSFGIHPRYSEYYIRRITGSSHEPIYKYLLNNSTPIKFSKNDKDVYVLEFHFKSENYRYINSLEQLDIYLKYNKYYANHAVSATIYVEDENWFKVGDLVYKNIKDIVGLTFFPQKEYKFDLAPYEKISKEQYESLLSHHKDEPDLTAFNVDSGNIFEQECTGDSCSIK